MTPSTDHLAAAAEAPGGPTGAPWLQDGAPLACHDMPAWRHSVALSEDVRLRQQWATDVEPLLIAQ